MPMKLFIASSSHREAVLLANAIKQTIDGWPFEGDETFADVCITEVWQTAFPAGSLTIEVLQAKVFEVDFAIFIFHPSDNGVVKGRGVSMVRDNVILEYGMFLGTLGTKRAFVVIPRGSGDLHKPSDIDGITYVMYDDQNVRANKGLDYRPAVTGACLQICAAMKELGPRKHKDLLQKIPLIDLFTTTGLTQLFEYREDALDFMLADIEPAERSVKLYARVYISELMHKEDRLSDALEKAILSSRQLRAKDGRFLVRQVCTNPEESSTVQRLYDIEDPDRQRWPTMTDFITHLKSEGLGLFGDCCRKLQSKLAKSLPSSRGRRRAVCFESAFYENYVTPNSLVIIDESVIYVGHYLLNPEERYGRRSPAVRVEDRGEGKSSWFSAFLEEARLLERRHVSRQLHKSWDLEVCLP
jgi:predicted nucleotide-binding protein with TIR-like domain